MLTFMLGMLVGFVVALLVVFLADRSGVARAFGGR